MHFIYICQCNQIVCVMSPSAKTRSLIPLILEILSNSKNRGLTTREIRDHLYEDFGIEIRPSKLYYILSTYHSSSQAPW